MNQDLLKSIPVINFDGQVQITLYADDLEQRRQLLGNPGINIVSPATEFDATRNRVTTRRLSDKGVRRIRRMHRNKVFAPYHLRTL